MKGSGTTYTVNSTSDASAVSQLITITWDAVGSSWSVVGSSSGYLGYYNTSGLSRPFPPAAPPQSLLPVTYTSPAVGDKADFALLGASPSLNQQKKLLF